MSNKLHTGHLYFLCWLEDSTTHWDKLSATRKGYYLDLAARGLVKQDDETYVFKTEFGDQVIDQLVSQLNELPTL